MVGAAAIRPGNRDPATAIRRTAPVDPECRSPDCDCHFSRVPDSMFVGAP
jgi:hypothetical protein